MNKFLKNKSFRFGSFSILLTVSVIAVVVVFNVIVSNLATQFNWYFDMTSENIYSVSEETKTVLRTLDDGTKQITIYFLADEAKLTRGASSSNSYGSSTLWGMKPIHELALELADEFDYISVDYIHITKEPDRIKEIVGDDVYASTTFAQNYVIIDNVTEYVDQNGEVYDLVHNARIFSRDSFYSFDYSTYYVNAFRGDYRLCTGIASVSVDPTTAPVAYFLTGHGESVGDYDWTDSDSSTVDYDYGDAQALWQTFRDCGFSIRKINLAYENFDAEGCSVAVIYAPQTDLIAESNSEQFNEISKLQSYMESEDHSLMVYMDTDTRTLTNLENFLQDAYGISFENAKIKDSGSHSVSTDGYSVVGDAVSSDYTDKAIFRSCRPIVISPIEGITTTVLYQIPSSSSATYQSSGEVVSYSEQQGQLMTLSETSYGSKVFACSTSLFVDGVYMDSPVYANRSVILSVIDSMTSSLNLTILQNPSYKMISSDSLDLTTQEALLWTIGVSAVLPTIFAVIGLVVFLRRRHS